MGAEIAGADRVDVLIVTAVKEEYDAVLAVHAGALKESAWTTRREPSGLDVAYRRFVARDGGDLLVAVIVVDFVGREEPPADLRAFCVTEAPVDARLVYGAGGMGKTRLLMELCKRLGEENIWRAGFVPEDLTPEQFAWRAPSRLPWRWSPWDSRRQRDHYPCARCGYG